MKKMCNWKLVLAIIAFIFSIVSFWAEMNSAETIDTIVTGSYCVVLIVIIIMDVFLFVRALKNSSEYDVIECYEDVVKCENRKLKRWLSRALPFLLMTFAFGGLIIHFNDANIIIKNIFSVLFALSLVLEAMIDLSKYKHFN